MSVNSRLKAAIGFGNDFQNASDNIKERIGRFRNGISGGAREDFRTKYASKIGIADFNGVTKLHQDKATTSTSMYTTAAPQTTKNSLPVKIEMFSTMPAINYMKKSRGRNIIMEYPTQYRVN